MNMRVYPDMPTRRREPNPMTCVSIPMHARSVLLAHAVGEPELAVALKGLCVGSIPMHTLTCLSQRGGSSAGVAVRGWSQRGGSSAGVAARGWQCGGGSAGAEARGYQRGGSSAGVAARG